MIEPLLLRELLTGRVRSHVEAGAVVSLTTVGGPAEPHCLPPEARLSLLPWEKSKDRQERIVSPTKGIPSPPLLIPIPFFSSGPATAHRHSIADTTTRKLALVQPSTPFIASLLVSFSYQEYFRDLSPLSSLPIFSFFNITSISA
jgi:hypothetical protein